MLDSYYSNYLFLAVFLVVAIIFPLMPLAIARIVAPRKPSQQKQDIYECGLESKGDAWVQFKVQYYIYALIFVIFDVETIFLYPWAVSFGKLGAFAFVEMIIFLAILAGGLIYAWKKGVLDWK
jgi:NADH:ubiquinone oxidoreductase subunit 3 (subunit A)